MGGDVGGEEEPVLPPWVTLVRRPEHPVEAAVEADARDAAQRYGHYVIRGPLFGLAVQTPDDGPGWRILQSITSGDAQSVRDSLLSVLWFRAKDEADDVAQRRELLAAVGRLETEKVDALTAVGVRYRVVRADEFVRLDAGRPEAPRPTDPEPAEADWGTQRHGPPLDEGFVIDPALPVTPMEAAERFAMGDLHYAAQRYPPDVRADSAEALHTHPGVVLLPPAFGILQRTEDGWAPVTGPQSTPQEARKQLHFLLDWLWPRMPALGGAHPDDYAPAAAALRKEPRSHSYELLGRQFLVTRIGRVVRIGDAGPEGPRPSDIDATDPMESPHPPMSDDGTVHYD
ncbi:DUF5954 family protein [Yinghuangia soli]|uniref:DUF5954 family protein n=1 Tax=Yinghuangia soli TaxID=2908204 RepID=A0AA41U4N3_9ACTN|nr:DUF5954 family protein [Yinghuangia soli]MCF2533115.1 DUF5954 family protein [Yinghuangia soli]